MGEELGICGLVKQGQKQTKTDQANEEKVVKCETGGTNEEFEFANLQASTNDEITQKAT